MHLENMVYRFTEENEVLIVFDSREKAKRFKTWWRKEGKKLLQLELRDK